MAFNYPTLKNINPNATVDALIKTGDIDNLQVTTSKIANPSWLQNLELALLA